MSVFNIGVQMQSSATGFSFEIVAGYDGLFFGMGNFGAGKRKGYMFHVSMIRARSRFFGNVRGS